MVKTMNRIKLTLINLKTLQIFDMYFDSEFERDKFRNKLKYSNKIKEVYRDNNKYSSWIWNV